MNKINEAVDDICGYISDIICKRELTPEEKHAIKIKIQFWYYMEIKDSQNKRFAEKFFHL